MLEQRRWHLPKLHDWGREKLSQAATWPAEVCAMTLVGLLQGLRYESC